MTYDRVQSARCHSDISVMSNLENALILARLKQAAALANSSCSSPSSICQEQRTLEQQDNSTIDRNLMTREEKLNGKQFT